QRVRGRGEQRLDVIRVRQKRQRWMTGGMQREALAIPAATPFEVAQRALPKQEGLHSARQSQTRRLPISRGSLHPSCERVLRTSQICAAPDTQERQQKPRERAASPGKSPGPRTHIWRL